MKTTKQDLVRKINELRNELNTLKGEQTYEYTAYDISEEARNHSVYDLESTIESLTKEIEQTKHQIKVKEYWNTHTDERKQLDEQREQLKQVGVQLRNKYIDSFNAMFAPLHMRISSISTSNIEVCSIENSRYRFEVYYNDRIEIENRQCVNKKRLEMNYPCYGSFEVMSDTTHTTYLLAMAAFANNLIMKEQVKRLFDEYEIELNNLRAEVKNIDNQINNPF